MSYISFSINVIFSVFVLLFSNSCIAPKNGINQKANEQEVVISNTRKDDTIPKDSIVPLTVKDNNLKPVITSRDSIIWTDTLVENEFVKYVVRYKKYTDMPVVRDTIAVIDISGDISTEKTEQTWVSRKKSTYNVAMILPFMANMYRGSGEIPAQSTRAVEFYEGVKIALDSLSREGVNLKLHVFDSKRDLEGLKEVLVKMEDKEWDLIIGPTSTDVLTELAAYAKENSIPMISPFNNNSEIAENNHYFIQVNPSYDLTAKYIVSFLGQVKPPQFSPMKKVKYLILATDEDSAKVDLIQKEFSLLKNDTNALLPQLYSKDAISVSSMLGYFEKNALNVIVIPTERNETFVFSALREISSLFDKVEKMKSYNFIVIGSPYWKYFERVNYEYYDNLKLHIADNYFIDLEERKNKQFEEGYRKLYGIAPREFAYTGFDVMLYFGRMLHKYGTAFPENFHQETDKRRHTDFKYEPVYELTKFLDGNTVREQKQIIRFENRAMNFLKFEEFQFKSVDIEVD
jgi:hypothetical protein